VKNLRRRRSRTNKASEIVVPPETESKPMARTTLRNTSAKELQNHRDRLVDWLKAHGINHHDAENLAQDALSKGLDVENLVNPEGWLFETAINGAVDLHRRKKTAIKHHQAVGHHEARICGNATCDPVAEASLFEESEIREKLLLDALAILPALDREILNHYYYSNSTYAELAKRFGLTQAAVKGRLQRARERLRSYVECRRHGPSGRTA
jgi:RNA polymerase sigma factor (sigma-70 family)